MTVVSVGGSRIGDRVPFSFERLYRYKMVCGREEFI